MAFLFIAESWILHPFILFYFIFNFFWKDAFATLQDYNLFTIQINCAVTEGNYFLIHVKPEVWFADFRKSLQCWKLSFLCHVRLCPIVPRSYLYLFISSALHPSFSTTFSPPHQPHLPTTATLLPQPLVPVSAVWRRATVMKPALTTSL